MTIAVTRGGFLTKSFVGLQRARFFNYHCRSTWHRMLPIWGGGINGKLVEGGGPCESSARPQLASPGAFGQPQGRQEKVSFSI